MPHRLFHTLYMNIKEKSYSEEGKKQLAGVQMQDKIKEGLGLT